ncbi:hypothetical protein V9K67_21660 [Paraflavisolibacter sp. H34]|uniref:hypothetical protein n=1 Tax=Huijunlia imazamoxiresistens TaxID=3127457 RepID=UPI0030184FF1
MKKEFVDFLLGMIMTGVEKHIDLMRTEFIEKVEDFQAASKTTMVDDAGTFFDDNLKKVLTQMLTKKSTRDLSIFKVRDLRGGKGPTALNLVRVWLQDHPGATYDQAKKVFRDEILKTSNLHFLAKAESISEKRDMRYFKEVLQTADGVKFRVSNQWGIGNFPLLQQEAEKLGYPLTKVED